MNSFAFLIKTLDRPTALERLLQSLRRRYPQVPVLVSDDSADMEQARLVCANYNAQHYPLGLDVGLSAGRNALFDAARISQYETAVLLDDDFVFISQSHIEKLVAYVGAGLCGVAAGTVLQQGQESHYEGTMQLSEGVLKLKQVRSAGGPVAVDIAYNFFAAHVSTMCQVRWDERLKICEHQAFFLRLQAAGVKVIYEPAVVMDHYPERNIRYNQSRTARANQFYRLFKELYGIHTVAGHL